MASDYIFNEINSVNGSDGTSKDARIMAYAAMPLKTRVNYSIFEKNEPVARAKRSVQFPPHEVLPATRRRFFSSAVSKAFSEGTKDGSNKSMRHSHPTAQRQAGVSPQTPRTPTVQLSRPLPGLTGLLFCSVTHFGPDAFVRMLMLATL